MSDRMIQKICCTQRRHPVAVFSVLDPQSAQRRWSSCPRFVVHGSDASANSDCKRVRVSTGAATATTAAAPITSRPFGAPLSSLFLPSLLLFLFTVFSISCVKDELQCGTFSDAALLWGGLLHGAAATATAGSSSGSPTTTTTSGSYPIGNPFMYNAAPGATEVASPSTCLLEGTKLITADTKRPAAQITLMGCFSSRSVPSLATGLVLQPYDFDVVQYWLDHNPAFFDATTVDPASFDSRNVSAEPAGDPAVGNFYRHGVIHGYSIFSGARPDIQPSYFPRVPAYPTNIPDVAPNKDLQNIRDRCAALCYTKYLDPVIAPATTSKQTIQFALAYGRCVCMNPKSGEYVSLDRGHDRVCCEPLPLTPYAPAVNNMSQAVSINEKYPMPLTCDTRYSYGVIYQISMVCPLNVSYCPQHPNSCGTTITAGSAACCLPLGATVAVPEEPSSGFFDSRIVQWLIAGVVVVVLGQFLLWLYNARKRRVRRREEAGLIVEEGPDSLTERLLLGPHHGDDGGFGMAFGGAEEMPSATDDRVGRQPTMRELEREISARNRAAAREEMEIILVPGPSNGPPLSVIIRMRTKKERDLAANEAMKLLMPVLPDSIDQDLCCPICTDYLTEVVTGERTAANRPPASPVSSAPAPGGAFPAPNPDPSRSGSTTSITNPSSVDDNNINNGNNTTASHSLSSHPSTPTTGGDHSPTAGTAANSSTASADALMSLLTTSNVVIMACKHMVHRECIHEYMSHQVKSYLAPIVCPICRGVVVVQNLAAEQEILKRYVLDFRCMVELEVLRLVMLGARVGGDPPRALMVGSASVGLRSPTELAQLIHEEETAESAPPPIHPPGLNGIIESERELEFSVAAEHARLTATGSKRDSLRFRPTRREITALRRLVVDHLRTALQDTGLMAQSSYLDPHAMPEDGRRTSHDAPVLPPSVARLLPAPADDDIILPPVSLTAAVTGGRTNHTDTQEAADAGPAASAAGREVARNSSPTASSTRTSEEPSRGSSGDRETSDDRINQNASHREETGPANSRGRVLPRLPISLAGRVGTPTTPAGAGEDAGAAVFPTAATNEPVVARGVSRPVRVVRRRGASLRRPAATAQQLPQAPTAAAAAALGQGGRRGRSETRFDLDYASREELSGLRTLPAPEVDDFIAAEMEADAVEEVLASPRPAGRGEAAASMSPTTAANGGPVRAPPQPRRERETHAQQATTSRHSTGAQQAGGHRDSTPATAPATTTARLAPPNQRGSAGLRRSAAPLDDTADVHHGMPHVIEMHDI